MKVRLGDEREFEILLLDGRGRAAEVVARADFLLSLIDGVLEFDRIDLEFHVKAGHVFSFSVCCGKP